MNGYCCISRALQLSSHCCSYTNTQHSSVEQTTSRVATHHGQVLLRTLLKRLGHVHTEA